ncbi:hypothetical protein LX32DRAFT_665268 [Colletotrichum zoysiae]|uniref:BHLH domain-containing protein n=1 Tax=Colletotrichum zoysiae TaxID=1216348 RepID=A0AAD9HCJ2_9PEZI|nr:hypothetical protein LX32DRAFT_665268 [Colletotrichum zoysiae]
MMASTPMSPAFDFYDRPHHATRPGNQPTLSSPGHNRPDAFNEPTRATPANQGQAVANVQSRQVADLQHQQVQQSWLRPSALGLGLTHADYAHQHQFGPGTATTSLADQQFPSPLLRRQDHQQQPNAWLPHRYGVPVYQGGQQHQQHADAASSPPSFSAPAAGVDPSTTVIPAAGGLGDNSSDSIGAGRHLYDFEFAAPPPGEPLFLGGEYADITPLSTAHQQPPTINLDFHPSPWRPRLQDSSSVTLTPNIAAVAAAELNHDVRKHGIGSMETDSDVKEPSWDNEGSVLLEARGGAAGTHKAHKTLPRARRQETKGKRRTVVDRGAEGGDVDNDDDDGVPANPAGRAGTSGRSIRSAPAASSAGSSSKVTVPTPPRLRSASRTSKNHSQKQTDTPEERRTRATHNLVEKQYRNRLNAQFEGLLHALPEQVRGGAGDESDPSQQADQERRVSKAEVLGMARRHIKNLEQEREVLHRERGELLRNLETLEREAAMGRRGGSEDSRPDEFLDVEGSDLDETSASSWRNA